MTRTRLLLVAVPALLLLGACGVGESDPPGPDSTPSVSRATPSTSAAPDPATTPAPGPAATATSDAPATLIDYGEDGVTLTTAADVSQLVGSPADFKTFIADELAQAQADSEDACTEKPQIDVSRIDIGGWAAGGHFIPHCGGNRTLWAKAGGTWKEVWGGQQLTDCKTLTTYAFPADVVGGTCLDGDKEVPYTAGGTDAK